MRVAKLTIASALSIVNSYFCIFANIFPFFITFLRQILRNSVSYYKNTVLFIILGRTEHKIQVTCQKCGDPAKDNLGTVGENALDLL